jgi:starch-binding outer membrane protein, SusD/RagB family
MHCVMKKINIILITSACAIAFSCNPERLDKTNPNQLTPDNYFKNSAELRTGVNSVYATIQGNGLVAREYFFLHDLRSDECATGGGQLETPRNQILIGAQIPSNAVLNEVWNALYKAIHRANTVIEKSADAKDDEALVKRLIGEAKFLRAWCYNELVTLWGGVPVYTVIATVATDTKARASEAEVYTQISEDLTAAIADLPESYSGAELGRATKGAARMLLARALMNQGNYDAAKTQLQAMVSSNAYVLNSNYYDNFSEETEWNKESVFEIGYESIGDVNWVNDGEDPSWGNQEKSTRSQEYSATGWRNLIPSQKMINEFESVYAGDAKTDPRRSFSVIKIGDKYANGAETLADGQVQGNTSTFEGATVKVSWYKYGYLYKQNPGGYLTSGINHRVMRYSDALLMLAECENEGGNSAAAITLMNQVRSRPSVAMPGYPTAKYPCANKAEVFAAVMHERMVELAGEQVRNRDILRWRKNGKLTSEPISYFAASKQELIPIPQGEIDLNDKIEGSDQNPGY